MNGKTFGIHFIPQKILIFHILDSVRMSLTCFAIAGAGTRMKSVPLQLQIWCSCITQRKRACTVLLNMIGAHWTCLLCVRAQKMVLSKFVKAHEQGIRSNLHDFRVIRADAEEGDTYIGGFLTEWTKSREKNCGQ
jgi:hypothetical protein